jgi:hypothetical protein
MYSCITRRTVAVAEATERLHAGNGSSYPAHPQDVFHDWRHSAVMLALARGKPTHGVAENMRGVTMTWSLYAHIPPDKWGNDCHVKGSAPQPECRILGDAAMSHSWRCCAFFAFPGAYPPSHGHPWLCREVSPAREIHILAPLSAGCGPDWRRSAVGVVPYSGVALVAHTIEATDYHAWAARLRWR